jgi:sodium pump decarboxylase gamma subunit
MNEEILLSIQITLVGMTLVFVALILLWWLIELLVRVTALRTTSPVEAAGAASQQPDVIAVPDLVPEAPDDRRQQVAAIAVALALAERDQHSREFPIPPTAIVSAWQAVNRANMLNKRGQVR